MTDERGEFFDVTLTVSATSRPPLYDVRWAGPDSPPELGREPVLFDADWLRGAAAELVRRSGPQPARADLLRRMVEIGEMLFDRLVGENFARQYDEAVERSRADSRRMRLRLDLPADLGPWPFELLRDPGRSLFLAANDSTTLVRGTPGPQLNLPPVAYPLRILLVTSEPGDVPPLQVEREVALLRERLGPLEELGLWEIERLSGAGTLQALRDHPAAASFHVLHFIGHGVVDARRQTPLLALTGADDRCDLVDPDRLNAVLARYAQLRLVVLNACHGARSADDRWFSSVAHSLSRLDIPAVVAMSQSVFDESAVVFSGEFYGRLCRRFPVDEAVNFARTSLLLADDARLMRDWPNPQLFLRSRSSLLFSIRQNRLPWEDRFASCRTDRRYADALELLRRVSELTGLTAWEWERVGEQVRLLADDLAAAECWPMLAELADAAPAQVALPGRARWQRLALGRLQFQFACEELTGRIRSGDVVAAGRALAECQGRIDALLELIQGVPADERHGRLYGEDPALWERFWSEDLRRLSEIRRQHTGPPIAADVLALLDGVDGLLASGAVPVDVPGEIGDDEAALLPAFLHAVADPTALAVARAEFLATVADMTTGNGGPVAADDLTARLLHAARLDAGVAWLAAGRRDRAVATWEEQLRTATDRREALRLCHHLALADFASPASRTEASRTDDADAPPVEFLSERTLSLWAVVLAGDHFAADDPPDADAEPAEDGSLARRVEQWLVGSAMPRNADGATLSHPAEERDLVLVATRPAVTQPAAPQPAPTRSAAVGIAWRPATPKQRWFAAELAAARRLRRLDPAAVTKRLPVAAGWGGVRELGLADALRDLFADLTDPITTDPALSGGSLRELRCLYSELRTAAEAALAGEPPEAVLHLLGATELAVPEDAPAARDRFEFLAGWPEAWRLCLRPCPREEFLRTGPAHAAAEDATGLLAEDLAWLCGDAAVNLLREECVKSPPDWETIEATVSVLRLLPVRTPDLLDDIADVQDRIVRRVRSEREDDGTADPDHVRLLEAADRLADNEAVAAALAGAMIALARQLLEEGQPDDAVRLVGSLVDRCPALLEARNLKCMILFKEAKDYVASQRPAEARANLQELIRTADESPEMDEDLLTHRLKANGLIRQLDTGPLPKPNGDAIAELEQLLDAGPAGADAAADDGVGPAMLIERARRKIDRGELRAALPDLEEAAYDLSASDAAERIVPLFLRLLENTSDFTDQAAVLLVAFRCCPDSPELFREARRLSQFLDRLPDFDLNDVP